MTFAAPHEEAFAKLLDLLGIEWEYEPTTFPLRTDHTGAIKSAFTPDFYIPSLNLYVEVTTQRTKTRKNQKMRLMNEVHPHINVVILFRDDLDMQLPTV